MLVRILVVHVTKHTCDAADGHEGTSEPRQHSEFF